MFGNVFEWAAVLEGVPGDVWAELTMVREVIDWDFQEVRDVVSADVMTELFEAATVDDVESLSGGTESQGKLWGGG
jgi:hypothetical protein